MRCVKCGKIINETVSSCSCGRDMKDIRFVVGNFIENNREFNWFSNLYSSSRSSESQTSGMGGLGGIGDITDLFKDTSQDNSFLRPSEGETDNILGTQPRKAKSDDLLEDIDKISDEKQLEDALKNLKF